MFIFIFRLKKIDILYMNSLMLMFEERGWYRVCLMGSAIWYVQINLRK